jgi:hypothetical protein
MSIEKILKNEFTNESQQMVDFDVLEKQIISKISGIEKRRFTTRFLIWGTVALMSLVVFVLSGITLYKDFVASGSSELFSIMLSDTGMVVANRNDFIYSLAESLPFGSIAAVFSAIALLLYSVRGLAKSYVNNLSLKLYGHE